MNFQDFYDDRFSEHEHLVEITQLDVFTQFRLLCMAAQKTLHEGGKLLLFGNGGSAATAQHIAAELVVRYKENRKALAALSLTTDTSVLTACANDLGYHKIFGRQIEAFASAGDMAIGFTTSGRSLNVLNAFYTAGRNDLITAVFSGEYFSLSGDVQYKVKVPSKDVARVQEMHMLLGHLLCEYLEGECA